MSTTQDFKVGEQVYFGRTFGEKTLGEVVKVNPAKLKIKQLDTRGSYKSYPVGTIWMVPPGFCSKVSNSEIAPAALAAKREERVVMNEIRHAYSGLSPENLSCDGELSRTAVARRRSALNAKLQALFTELGRKVSEEEAYGV